MQNCLEAIIGDYWNRTKFKVAISSINLLDLLVLQVNYTKLIEMLLVSSFYKNAKCLN
jgi:hypothetical protein